MKDILQIPRITNNTIKYFDCEFIGNVTVDEAIKIGNIVIERYKELGVDPTTKTIVFSNNALDFPKYLEIANYFKGRIRVSAGISTNWRNDIGFKPNNIVMKLSKCRINPNQEWRKCIKISDDLYINKK